MSIKIEGPGHLRSSSIQKSGRAGPGKAGSFAKQIAGDSASPSGVSGASPLTGIDALLALQEVDDATARASRGKQRARDMLDKLEELKLGLLAGGIPASKLVELAKIVQSRRAQVDDPKLAEILDEIDLRAQVELAKLTP